MFLVAALLWWLAAPAFAAVPILLAAFFLWFFRDPERTISAEPGLIVSPADGKVTDISPAQLNGKSCTRVSIFLNVFDVHVNRSPVAGTIKDVVYKRGQFGNAMSPAPAETTAQNFVTVEGHALPLLFNHMPCFLRRPLL